jgi:hypothetical protein
MKLLAFGALLSAAVQDKNAKSVDRTKGLAAGSIVAKGCDAMKRLKGYHVSIDVKSERYNGRYDGICKGDGAACKGPTLEMFARMTSYLARTSDGRVVAPTQLDVQTEEGKAAAAFRNPAALLAEIQASAAQNPPALKEDEGECRVVVVTLGRAQKEAFMKEAMSKISLPIPVGNPSQFIDMDKSSGKYTVWVRKSDLRIVKYVFELDGKLKPGLPLPPGIGNQISGTTTVENSKFDADLDWEIPKEVQSRLGLK